MKIALIGGSGFIGSVLARHLDAEGHDLTIIDLVPSALFPRKTKIIDVRDAESLSAALKGIDAVYHLAAEHRDDVRPIEKYYDVNVGGARNLVAAAEKHNIRKIIFTSSVALYGLDAGDSKETDTPDPFNDYGRSKLESEKVFETWAHGNPQNTLVTTRLVATFGPGNRGNVFTLMDQIARGKFIMVGSGRNKKSIAYVENVASFLVYCLDMDPGTHLYNYADKPDLDMNEMVTTIRRALGLSGAGTKIPYAIGLAGGLTFDVAAKLTGRNFPISVVRVQKFCANTIVNSEKARASGFTAPFSLQHGLQQMIAAEFPVYQKAA